MRGPRVHPREPGGCAKKVGDRLSGSPTAGRLEVVRWGVAIRTSTESYNTFRVPIGETTQIPPVPHLLHVEEPVVTDLRCQEFGSRAELGLVAAENRIWHESVQGGVSNIEAAVFPDFVRIAERLLCESGDKPGELARFLIVAHVACSDADTLTSLVPDPGAVLRLHCR